MTNVPIICKPDLLSKSTEWFLYDRNIGRYRVNVRNPVQEFQFHQTKLKKKEALKEFRLHTN